ncbi:unnamed protein product [Brassica oleracea]
MEVQLVLIIGGRRRGQVRLDLKEKVTMPLEWKGMKIQRYSHHVIHHYFYI